MVDEKIKFNCCNGKSVSMLSLVHSWPKEHFICHICGSHLYGDVVMNKKEWNAWVNGEGKTDFY